MRIGLNYPIIFIFAIFMSLVVSKAHAQQAGASVLTTCGSVTYSAGKIYPTTQDIHGNLCGSGGGGGGSTPTKPGSLTLVPLDISTVTTGGTAVTALNAGHASAGGFIQNPKGASVDLCINGIGTASGTTSSANTTCIPAGSAYYIPPSAAAVSVISSDSSHPFSGEGFQ